MNMFCKSCDQYMPDPASHVCPPAYEVIFANYGEEWDDAVTMFARSHREAAEKAAENRNHNAAEYGRHENVHVRKQGESDIFAFDVEAETVMLYTATGGNNATEPEAAPC